MIILRDDRWSHYFAHYITPLSVNSFLIFSLIQLLWSHQAWPSGCQASYSGLCRRILSPRVSCPGCSTHAVTPRQPFACFLKDLPCPGKSHPIVILILWEGSFYMSTIRAVPLSAWRREEAGNIWKIKAPNGYKIWAQPMQASHGHAVKMKNLHYS